MPKSKQSSLGSIPASSDTVKSEGRQIKQCWIQEIEIHKNPPVYTICGLIKGILINFSPVYCGYWKTLLFTNIEVSSVQFAKKVLALSPNMLNTLGVIFCGAKCSACVDKNKETI